MSKLKEIYKKQDQIWAAIEECGDDIFKMQQIKKELETDYEVLENEVDKELGL